MFGERLNVSASEESFIISLVIEFLSINLLKSTRQKYVQPVESIRPVALELGLQRQSERLPQSWRPASTIATVVLWRTSPTTDATARFRRWRSNVRTTAAAVPAITEPIWWGARRFPCFCSSRLTSSSRPSRCISWRSAEPIC